MAMEMEEAGKKALKRLAENRAQKAKQQGKNDPDAKPGFKSLPFLTKVKGAKSASKKKYMIPRSPTN